MTAFPKPGIVRMKTKKEREALRLACYLRDKATCTRCGRRVWLRGGHEDQMHMAHVRNKRMYGDVLENVTTRCQDCHMVGMHNPKSVPPKGALALPSTKSNRAIPLTDGRVEMPVEGRANAN